MATRFRKFWYRPWRSNPNKRFFLGISGFSLMALFPVITKSCADLVCSLVCGHLATHALNALPNRFTKGFLRGLEGGDVGWKFTCRGIKISSTKPQDNPISYSIFQTTLRNKLEGNFLCEDLLMVPCCHNWLGTIANWVQEWSNTLRYAGFLSRT